MINVINVISDKNIGGAGKCILTFLKYYDREKFNVTVIVPRDSLLIEDIEKLGAKYIEIDGISDKSLDVSAILKLRKVIKKLKPDIVHCHAAMAARIAAKSIKNVKVIYTRHSVFEPKKMISQGIGKAINGCVNNFFADEIIAVAKAAKDNLTKTGVADKKITVIKNGVEPLCRISEEDILKTKSNYNIGDDDFVMGIVARLNEVKGHIYILRALKYLIDDGFKVKLLIAGTGDFEDKIRDEISRLGIEENVIMAGFAKDVTPIMNVLDLNLNASFGTEATSLALLEGMSLSVPIVASDFGGNPGVVYDGQNGFLFKSKSAEDMYEKIKLILENSDLKKRLKDGCSEIFNKEFTAQIVTEKIQNVYTKISSRKDDKI